ncbi:50s ribosomal l24 [Trichoderma arundinaceum]|uniref:50s ribosomal l24 n=1 Tax=Trichoderma arundinaceum TaxID=490622 RepID=A0A395NX07_TRIAR|nr:50s ribosomal l24 [Trichoderma arundinaceum]
MSPALPSSARPLMAMASSASRTASRISSACASSLRQPLSPSTTSSAARAFSTTSPRPTKTVKPHRLPSDLIPPYPYGERRVYKQSNNGLYGSARIRFGNNVAEKHNNKSRRFWRPNVHVKTFLIPALGARIKTRLTLRVLKTIRREGGIENYLLKSKPARLKELGPGGWNLRWLLMQSQAVQQRFNDERVALGLEPRELEDRDDVIQYALDYATPGPLSLRSQATLAEMRAALDETFVLGDEDLADLEGIQELSDEEEELLLRHLDSAEEAARAKGIKAEKQGAEV